MRLPWTALAKTLVSLYAGEIRSWPAGIEAGDAEHDASFLASVGLISERMEKTMRLY